MNTDEHRWNARARLICVYLCSSVVPLICGCQDFGAGGTGELVVPKQVLRQVEPMDESRVVTTRASTEPSTRPASTQPTQVPLSIERVRELALANNLDLKVQRLEPTIFHQRLGAEEAAFEAVFTTDVNYAVLDQPTSTQLNGSQVKDLRVTPGVRLPLRTGGTIDFTVPMERFETNNQFSTLNPAYTSDALVSLTQPLLRNFGPDATASGIRVAFYQYQESQARTKLEMIRVLADADRAYWRLYAAREILKVRKQEYDLGDAQLERARRQARAGVIAEVDVVRAESGVADRLEAIILAENVVRDRERELKRILNDTELPLDASTVVLPTSEPRGLAWQLDANALVDRAMAGRMELLEQELRIAEEEANVAFAKNQMLPLLTLSYQYGVNGLGGSFDDSFAMVRRADFQDHRVGLQLEIPIGNEAARSRLRAALASRLQQLATKEQRALTIRQEVYTAVDELEANWQRYLAARKRVVLAARVLDVEIRQFNQGLRTSTDVLDAQTRLANARSDEIAALTDHQIAQVDIAFATGTVLGAAHVDWQPAPAPPVRW